jgi:regulator of protease activity HflC (stomatin/prohibitin superfamily)
MVAKVGSIDNLIVHVVHPMIDSSFRNQASATSAMNFMQDRQDEQKKAEDRARSELEKYHVECVSVLICQIALPQDLMDTQTKKIIAQQEQAQYTEQQKAEQARISTEKTRAEADQQQVLVASEINVKVAEQNRQATIKSAEAEGEALRLKAEGEAKGITAKGEAEGNKILAIGEATAKAFELQGKVIGGSGLTAIALAERIKDGQIKVTPDFLVQGSGSGELGGLLAAFLVNQMTKAIAPAPSAPAVTPVAPAKDTAEDATA